MSRLVLLALSCLVACNGNFNNGFAVGLRVLADGSVAAKTVTMHVDVSGAETFRSDAAASSKFIASGEERVLYRPGVTAGTLDFSVEARDANGTALASGQARGVVLRSGETVTVDVPLTPPTAPPDLLGVDLFGVDLFTSPPDLAGADLTPVCAPSSTSCQTTTLLRTCAGDGLSFADTPCALGCSMAPSPHCKQVVPSANGVTTTDLDGTGLGDIAIIANTTLDSDTGAIPGVRVANSNKDAREVISGIAFHRATLGTGKIGIFSFNSLTIGDGKTLLLQGPNPVAMTSAGDITILGILDGRGPCSGTVVGPGGGRGGSVAGLATGPGKGTAGASNASDATSGGSGGGFGDSGGNTSQIGVGQTTLGGVNYGNAALVPLLAGSGGGRGGDGNSATSSSGGTGGNGGGAIQLVAVGTITIGTGSSPGGLNFGGCGGGGAAMPAGIAGAGAGGGGGSGGAVLIEAPTVNISSFGVIAVNGGAGGGGATGTGASAQAGFPASFTTDQSGTHGSMAFGSACGNGGFGGASVVGSSVSKGQAGVTGGTGGCTGGGGGGAGRIRINSLTGAATISGGGYTSPQIGDVSSHSENLTTQAVVTTQ